ncbi:MAG: hypothetical protein LBE85_01415 [Candidatus Accumulibacter sp.]|jgi:hypothetical protein|nr:hypothetical protein [Accumulibacter sp.]
MTHSKSIRSKDRTARASSGFAARQKGVVLIIALVVLIAMTLSALTLIRSVNTTNLIAGNLAFRESALLSSERATETALAWLIGQTPTHLYSDDEVHGYVATRPPDDWKSFWNDKDSPVAGAGTDVAGNTVSYVIHRLCDKAGNPNDKVKTNCSEPPLTSDSDSKDTGKDPLAKHIQVYYRITSRVAGPRNTAVHTQTIIAL